MDVDNSKMKSNQESGVPLDVNGQLTQPYRKDVQGLIKSQKANQWGMQEPQPMQPGMPLNPAQF